MVKRAPRRRNHPEDDEMRIHVVPPYVVSGFKAYVNATRVAPVGVTPGTADLTLFSPKHGFHFYHEVKIGSDRQSQTQREFQEMCVAAGVAYVLGDRTAGEDFLVWLGFGYWVERGLPNRRISKYAPLDMERDRLVFMRVDRPELPGGEIRHWNTNALAGRHDEKWGYKASRGAVRAIGARVVPASVATATVDDLAPAHAS